MLAEPITIPEARKLLGDKYKNLSDGEIKKQITLLDKLADIIIDTLWDMDENNEKNLFGNKNL